MTSPTGSPTTPSSPTQRRLPTVTPERAGRWVVLAAWAALLVTAGPALADALAGHGRAGQVVASTGLWAAWAGVIGALLVPRTVSLTGVRMVVPAAVPATAWAAVATGGDGLRADAVAGLVLALVAAGITLSALVGDAFVNGSSYGDERRFPLRAPTPLLAGPIPLAWAAGVAGVVTGPLLLAAGNLPAGIPALVVGLPVAAVTARALHGLARRWLVFVPAGFVVHDPLTLAEPVLCTRHSVARVAPALAGTEALDLTAGASGLAVQVDLSAPAPAARRSPAETVELTSFLVAPTRPGAVLREARRRRLPVG
jgi:hypothetical protein